MTNRRNFLKHSSYVAAGSLLIPLGCSNKKQIAEDVVYDVAEEAASTVVSKNLGVQVYSVRDALKEDFAGSMGKLADIGYKYIEGYGLGTDGKIYDMTPTEYKTIVSDLGMQLKSAHATYFTPDQAEAVRDAAAEAGIEYVIVPYLNDDLRSDYNAIAENLNKVGEVFKDSGIKLGYHNHAFEFEKQGDQVPLEILLAGTDPSLVTFQADLYWVVKAGADPMELINKYPGRFSLFHVKDANEALDQTTVGSGIIDFKSILEAKDLAGMQYYFVEDERQDDPFGNLAAAYNYLLEAEFAV